MDNSTYDVHGLEDIVEQCVVGEDGENGECCLGGKVGHFLRDIRDNAFLSFKMRTDCLSVGNHACVRTGTEHEPLKRLVLGCRTCNLLALGKLQLQRLLISQFEERLVVVGECKNCRGALKSLLETFFVIEICRNDFDAFCGECLCLFAGGVSCGTSRLPPCFVEKGVDKSSTRPPVAPMTTMRLDMFVNVKMTQKRCSVYS